MRALVISCRRNGLAVIRSLAQHGVETIAADTHFAAEGLHSRYVSRRLIVSDPGLSQESLIHELCAVGRCDYEATGEKTYLIPTNDEYVLAFASHWDELSNYFHAVFETDLEIVLDCMDKTRMYRIADAAGVPYPRTVYSPLSEESVDSLTFPVVVKPANRRSPAHTGKNFFRIRTCNSRIELADTTELLESQDIDFVVQEFIPGDDSQLYTAGIFAYHGMTLAAFTGRKLRQFPPATGECSYGEVVRAPEIIKLAEQFVSTAGYTGIAQVEFKHCNGKYYLMEINPRTWSWVSLSTFAGVNLPLIACQVIGTGQMRLIRQQRSEGTWNYLGVDLIHNVFKNHNITLCQALCDAVSADCHAHWQFSDPVPALVHYKGFVQGILRSSIKRLLTRIR